MSQLARTTANVQRRTGLGPVSRTSRLQWPSAVRSRSRLLSVCLSLLLHVHLASVTQYSSLVFCLSHRTSLVSQSVEHTGTSYSHTPPLALVPVRGGTGRRNPRGQPRAGTCILVHTLPLSVRPPKTHRRASVRLAAWKREPEARRQYSYGEHIAGTYHHARHTRRLPPTPAFNHAAHSGHALHDTPRTLWDQYALTPHRCLPPDRVRLLDNIQASAFCFEGVRNSMLTCLISAGT